MDSSYTGRRVLVTGGIGFIGSNLAIRLVELGADVLLVDSMLPAYGADLSNIEPVRERVRVNYSDIRDSHSLAYLVQDEDVIFSLAGQVSHSESMADPMTDLEINCAAQLSLLECCRRHNSKARIVFASTRQLYGRPKSLPVTEDHPLDPVDVNGINNLAAEMYYSLYHQVYGIPTVSLRLTNTFGPRMDLRSPNKGFAGVFIRQALAGQTIRVFGDGNQRRDFNHVDDVVEALLLAGAKDDLIGRVFNLGHPQPHSLNEFVACLERLTGCTHEHVPFPADAEMIDIGDYYGDFDRFSKAAGWNPAIGLEQGLEDTIAWFRQRNIG
ncbi:MAG: NAD-dependent epimerase/dehydratase family protein [Acidobacteria bacterium]|nr:NAD-dependent epimerase/dehydratase family protein [Acidobacteriota bacterium]NIM60653.1 NAD-dependent epimerase/dehydratase family protein [Acidobacteriota bacterium]NIO57940.1 NAD-dependent epimerase/dehydratase family protein [Acidobacteriota bacterium]NIQ28943.1 NAD-dependent epimerase/dehydratase family protein [Acidobacteriota bacterium]NIQ83417.1 NAD-dependent epimerase/dehydratase family protein [Acidobacteriota bacterium]